jgi:hypothetical protein
MVSQFMHDIIFSQASPNEGFTKQLHLHYIQGHTVILGSYLLIIYS